METDSCEYEILQRACQHASGLTGLSCELGVRAGGSSHLIMSTFNDANAKRPHIAVDPYGNIEYRDWETRVLRCDYTNDMMHRTMAHVHAWAHEHAYPFLFFALEDTEFFTRFADGVPVYNTFKSIHNEYSLVFFDACHTVTDVRRQIDFFASRTQQGGMWVFDDIEQYPHVEVIDPYIQKLGFQCVDKGRTKMSYKKIM